MNILVRDVRSGWSVLVVVYLRTFLSVFDIRGDGWIISKAKSSTLIMVYI